jgi:hypothetical protein
MDVEVSLQFEDLRSGLPLHSGETCFHPLSARRLCTDLAETIKSLNWQVAPYLPQMGIAIAIDHSKKKNQNRSEDQCLILMYHFTQRPLRPELYW